MDGINDNGANDNTEISQYPQQQQQQEYYPQTSSGKDWRFGLSPELQPSVSKYKDLEGFVRAHREMENLVGKKADDFSKKDWQTYKAMMSSVDGIPPSADGYEIDPLPVSGTESLMTEEDTLAIQDISYSLGLNNEQAQALHDVGHIFCEKISEIRQQQADEQFEKCMSNLADSWGNAFESKINSIESAVSHVLPQLVGADAETIREELFEAGVYNSPVMLKILSAVGEIMTDSSSRGYSNITPSDARYRLDNIKNDNELMKARVNRHDPIHRRAVEELKAMCEFSN
jgi:hypothetical protein